jgi:3',5'-cyclic AMP phosphodiesterase CpdA
MLPAPSRWLLLLLAGLLPGCQGETPPPRASPPPEAAATSLPARPPRDELKLPRRPGSIRFAVIGDSGRGHPPQYEVAARMQAFREAFDYGFVLMLGDNVYDGGTPEDYRAKFERPYAALLEGGVKFYAVIGNHDDPGQHRYPLFNTGGRRYYTFKPDRPVLGAIAGTDVRFFMLDTENLDNAQRAWLQRALADSDAAWKIVACHRPLYTSGRYALPARRFRALLEPLLVRHGVSAVFSGHEHFYERIHPQSGITYFISGGAGSLRRGDIRKTALTASGFDEDYHFMLVEIAGDELFFQAVSRTGTSVDWGTVRRRE